MNTIQLLQALLGMAGFYGGKNGRKVKKAVSRKATFLVYTLLAALLVPLALFFVGIASGFIGTAIGSPTTVSLAEFILGCGAAFAMVTAMAFGIKVLAYSVGIGVGVNVAGNVPGLRWLPFFSKEEILGLFTVVMGWTAWYGIACVSFIMLPVWRHPALAVSYVVLLLTGSAIMVGWKSNSPWPRRIAISVWAFAMVYVVSAFFFSQHFAALSRYMDSWGEDLTAQAEYDSEVSRIDRVADAAATKLRTDRLAYCRNLRTEIEARAANDCGGAICSLSDQQEFDRCGEEIAAIRDGTWSPRRIGGQSKRPSSKRGSDAGRTEAERERPPARRPRATGNGSSVARMAPPPGASAEVSVRRRASVGGSQELRMRSSARSPRPTPSRPSGGSSPLSGYTNREIDYIFQGW